MAISPDSRYARVAIRHHVDDDGREVAYLGRRFAPQPTAVPAAGTIVVQPDERIDNVTYRATGNAEDYWRIADANLAMDAFGLARPGKRLVVPGPSTPEDSSA